MTRSQLTLLLQLGWNFLLVSTITRSWWIFSIPGNAQPEVHKSYHTNGQNNSAPTLCTCSVQLLSFRPPGKYRTCKKEKLRSWMASLGSSTPSEENKRERIAFCTPPDDATEKKLSALGCRSPLLGPTISWFTMCSCILTLMTFACTRVWGIVFSSLWLLNV